VEPFAGGGGAASIRDLAKKYELSLAAENKIVATDLRAIRAQYG